MSIALASLGSGTPGEARMGRLVERLTDFGRRAEDGLAVASLLGAAVPLALKALHQDPALGAGVIVTTLTDAVAFVAFLRTATLLLDLL